MRIYSGWRLRHQTLSKHVPSRAAYGRNTPESQPTLLSPSDFAALLTAVYARMLVYNLSPSFNWAGHGFSDADLKAFIWELAKEGFTLQLVSLAGLHSGAVTTAELSARYKEDGMLAYVELIQRKEKEIGCDVLTHQKW